MKMFCTLIKLLMVILCLTVSATLRGEPLGGALSFYVSFDQSVDPDQAKGDKAVKKFGNVKLISGANGNAAEFSKPGDYLEYIAKENLNPQQGTIAFYIKDIDVRPDQRVWNSYFQWLGGQNAFNIARLWQPLNIAGGIWSNGNLISLAETPIGPKNKWRHLAFTYQRNVIRLYCDGEEKAVAFNADFKLDNPNSVFTTGRLANPQAFADSFRTGLHLLKDAPEKARQMRIGTEPYGSFAIDEFCAFNRPLTAKEIKNLAKLGLNKASSQDFPEELSINLQESLSLNQLRVLVAGCRLRPDSHLNVDISNAAGKVQVASAVKVLPSGSDYVYLSTEKLEPGNYTIRAMAKTPGANDTTVTIPYVKRSSEVWIGNKLGTEDVVLPGLLPLKADADKVDLWGRTYYFQRSLMPVRIVNQEHEILRRPVSWHANVNGRNCDMVFNGVKLIQSSLTRAVYAGSGTLGPVKIEGRTTVEYDGFMRFDLTFIPPADGIKVCDLTMEIPFVKDEASLLFYQSSRSAWWPDNWRSAVTPLGEKGVITIGNPDRCLQWMIESDQYYYPEDNPKALQTAQTKDTNIFKTVVIDGTRTLNKPFTLTYALQAGPVKPRPDHWRGWTRAGRRYCQPKLHNLVNYSYDWWARSPGEPIPADGFPVTPDKSVLKDAIPNVSMHFGGFRETKEAKDPEKRTPEWKKYESEWQRVPQRLVTDTFPGWNEQTIDTKSASWGDWHVWCVNELFRTTGVRGLYYDDWLPGESKNEFAGSGYIGETGVRRPTRDIFNQREFHRRVYALVKHYRPDDGTIYIHVSGCPILPIISFCDINYDGEVMVWSDRLPPDGRYFDSYRMDIFQILFSARQFGPVPGFHDVTTKTLSTGGSPKILLKQNQRQLWALLLLHDIHLQSAFTSGMEELRFMWLDTFGIAEQDVKFSGYWDSCSGAKLEGFFWKPNDRDAASKGYISVYKRPGKALLIIVRDAPNNYSGAVMAKVRIDRAKLGLPQDKPLRSMDMESMGRTPLGKISEDVLQVPIDTDDFVAVLIEVVE